MKKFDAFRSRIKEASSKAIVFQPPPPRATQNTGNAGQSHDDLSSGNTSTISDQELSRTKQVSVGLCICGALIAVGCLLPWATVLGGLLSINGIDTNDGTIVLILGIVILVAGIYVHPNFSPKRSGYVIALICSILSFLISLIDIIDIGSLASDTSFASVGGGLYLCVIGSAGALFLSVIGTFKLKNDGKGSSSQISKPPPPPPKAG